MYHCHLQFYIISPRQNLFSVLQQAQPLPAFTHSFQRSDSLNLELAAQADAIFADLRGQQAQQVLGDLCAVKKPEALIILLADPEQTAGLTADPDCLTAVQDIWPAGLSQAELRFRFSRWQRALKESKDSWETNHFFQATIENIPNLIWYKDKNGIHEKVNSSFCKTVNKTKAQVQGRGHAYIWDVEEDDPACIESEAEVMSKRQTCVSEETVKTRDGAKLLTTYKSPLYDLDGSVMGTVGVAIDVTQEKSYQRELVKKNQLLESIFTTLDCGVLCHTVDGSQILSVNKAALRILGYESQQQLLEAGFDMIADSVLEEDKERLRRAILSLQREGDSVSVEYRVRHNNGEVLHILGSVKLLMENDQLFYQRFLLDYTEQKLQETRERMEQERRQMELVQALSIDYNLVCSFDLDTGLGSAMRIHDCEYHVLDSIFSGELLLFDCMERYILSCVYEADRDTMRRATSAQHLKETLLGNDTFYINYRTLCGSKIRYFQMKAVRAGSWEQSHTVVLGFRSMDEETRKEMKEKSLLEDALNQANRASQAKSVFLSNMSHDIRTPMNAIIGFTTLAAAHIDQRDRVEGYLQKIMTSGNHLLSLINDILDMSHIESGKIHLEEKPCSLPEILRSLRNMVQADVLAKQLTLRLEADQLLDEQVYCDHLRLNQVLLNLLSNAIKYTNPGGSITLSAIKIDGAPEGRARYQFRVRDTGIGMSPEFLSHIFEPFERERNSTISGIQGTGLGMSITKNIVDMMGGDILVESQPGVGTQVQVDFTFRLCTEPGESPLIPALENRPALIVDGNTIARENIAQMLQQMGIRPEQADSGQQALHLIDQAAQRREPYWAYLVDWKLPDQNSMELIRDIRRQIEPDIAIVLLTECDLTDWPELAQEAHEAGATAFCVKPLLLSELRQSLLVSANQPLEAEQPAKHRCGRILLTEDNELNQEIAVAILEEAGFSVDVAENGQVAVDRIKASSPGYYQLVLMDIQMPVMNGYQAAQTIRQLEDPQLSTVPIIAMTANAFEEDKQAALEHGMNGHIAKPIDINILFNVLDKVLQS